MASPAYRAAPGSVGPILLAGLVMGALYMTMMPLLGLQLAEKIGPVLLIGPPLVTFVPCTIFCLRRHRRRMAGLANTLTGSGFRPSMKPTEAEKTELWSQIGHLVGPLDLQGGAEKIRWLAHQHNSANPTHPAWIFEFEYTTGSGDSTQGHPRTVIAWPASFLSPPGVRFGNQPGFLMARLTAWELKRRRKQRDETSTLPPALAELSHRWHIIGDPVTGQAFLTPAVRAVLADSPKGEVWSLGGGWVCCLCKAILNGKNLGLFYEHAQRTLR